MPLLSSKATRTSSRLALALSIWVIFTSAKVCAFSLASWVPSEGTFALGNWQGGVIGGYEWEDQQTSASGLSSSVMRNRFDEDVSLSNDGFYLLDPRLLEGNAGTDCDFYQESDKFTGSKILKSGSQNGTLIGFNVNTQLFSEMAYTGFLFARRNETQTSTDFGGRTDLLTQSFGGMAFLRQYSFLRDLLPYLSGDVYARQEENDEKTTQLGQTFKIDETRNIAGADVYKGFQTADLDFNYQYIDDKYTGSIPYSFVTNILNLFYSLDFGPTLNRRWDSQINYLTLSGNGTSQSFLYADERLRIDHFRNLATTYEYLLVSTDSNGIRETSNTAIFQLQYSPFRNLTNNFMLEGFYDTISSGGGHLDYYAVEDTPSYYHAIPWGGTLTLSTGGRYEIDQNHTEGSVPVVDEKHTAPAFFGPGIGFNLRNAFVVTSTIVMYDTFKGRIPCKLGVDYITEAQGQFTKIVILPTTILIHPNDPLEVSYSYIVGPTGRYITTTWSANAGVNFGWIALNFSHQQLNQSLQSGTGAQYLYNFHQENVQLNLHKEWEFFDARGLALYQVYHTRSQATGAFGYTLQSYGEFFSFHPPWLRNTTTHLDGDETFIDYPIAPTRKNTYLDFEASLDCFLASGYYFTAFARALRISQTSFYTETDYEAGIRGNFQYGKIFIWPWFSFIRRDYGPTRVTDPHIMLRIGRVL